MASSQPGESHRRRRRGAGAAARRAVRMALLDRLRARAHRGERDRPGRAVLGLGLIGRPAGVRIALRLVGLTRVGLRAAHALARGGDRVALEGVVLARLRVQQPRDGGGVVRRRRRVDLLEREEHHGDVVATAGGVGGGDQIAAELIQRPAVLEQQRLELVLAHHRGQPVRADQEEIAGLGREVLDVDLHGRLGPERAGDDGALRVRLGLLLGQLAEPDQVADQRVVVGQALELAVADQVAAGVADVRDRHEVLADVGGRHGRAHARALALGPRALEDAQVGLLDQAHQADRRRLAVGDARVEDLDGHLGRDLAGLRAAHAVGDDEQGRANEVVVFVALPLQAQVGTVPVISDPQHAHRSKENSLSPILMRSPACRG